MKGLLRRFVFYSASLFVVSTVFSGLIIRGGLYAYFVGSIVLSFLMLIVKPVLHVLSFPINMITFGLFTFIINGFILFLLTFFYPIIHVGQFNFPHLSFAGFETPSIFIIKPVAFVVIAAAISFVYGFLDWLML